MDLKTFITNLPQNETVISSLTKKLENILEKLENSQEVRKTFIKNYPAWAERRKEIIKQLHYVAEASTTHRKNVNITHIVGSSFGIAGGVTSIVLGLAFPFSIPIATVGIASLVLGGGTNVISSITEEALEVSNKNKIKKLLQEDIDNFAQIRDWLSYNYEFNNALKDLVEGDGFQDLVSHFKNTWEEIENFIKTKEFANSDQLDPILLLQLLKGFCEHQVLPSSELKVLCSIALAVPRINPLLKKVINYYNICRLPYIVLAEGIKIFGGVVQAVTMYTSQGGKIIGEVGAVLGKRVGTRVLMSSAGVAVDAVTLGLAIYSLADGSKTEFATKIQEAKKKLQEEADFLDLIYEETKK